MDEENQLDHLSVPEYKTISTNKFITLCVFSLNLYGLWWMYKSWRYFKFKEGSDILPGLRAIFSIFFMYSLFEKIKLFSNDESNPTTYSSFLLYIGVLLFNLSGYLPEPFNLLAIFSCGFFVPAFEAFDRGIILSNDFAVEEQEGFNNNQMLILIFGSIFWVLLIVGLFSSPQA